MTGLALHMGYQAETAVILEFIWLVQTCFHRHFLTRLPLIRANFFSIQPLTIRAGRTPALRGQKGGHCTHRHLASQIWRRNVANLCRICERFKAIYCASQNFFNFDRYDSKTTVTQTPQGTRPRVCWCLLTNRVAMPTCARQGAGCCQWLFPWQIPQRSLAHVGAQRGRQQAPADPLGSAHLRKF